MTHYTFNPSAIMSYLKSLERLLHLIHAYQCRCLCRCRAESDAPKYYLVQFFFLLIEGVPILHSNRWSSGSNCTLAEWPCMAGLNKCRKCLVFWQLGVCAFALFVFALIKWFLKYEMLNVCHSSFFCVLKNVIFSLPWPSWILLAVHLT